MASGALIIEFSMPPIPPDAGILEGAFTKLVIEHIKTHFVERNIEPSRYTWLDRTDVPEDDNQIPAFIKACIAETGIDSNLVEPAAGGTPICCFQSTSIVYYFPHNLQWNGPPIENPFAVVVPLPDGKTVTVALSCVVTRKQYLPTF